MLREMHGKQTLPKEVANQLAGMLFSVPSSTAPYLIGLVITPIVFWMRSQNVSLTAIAVFSVVLIQLGLRLFIFSSSETLKVITFTQLYIGHCFLPSAPSIPSRWPRLWPGHFS
jgi:hypothetical protein